MNRRRVVPQRFGLAALVAVGVLAGCRGGHQVAQPSTAVSPSTTTSASQPGGLGGGGGEGEQTSVPRSTVITTPKPSLSTPNGVKEVDGSCPYISNQDFADDEGDRVGRVTVLQTKPVGCRFYFAYDSSAVVGEIDVDIFKTPTEAYNAMVGSAHGHPEVQSDSSIGAGAVAFQKDLQGTNAWLCVFAKGTSVVTVRTRQPYPALNAFTLAKAIVPRVK